MKVKTKIIDESLKFRIASEKNPSYTGKIVSALREQFGGHTARLRSASAKATTDKKAMAGRQ